MEQMLLDRIMVFNWVMNTIIFSWVAKIYLLPKLKDI